MEVSTFIQESISKFEFLKRDFGFNNIEEDHDMLRPHVIFEKRGLKIQITYLGIESPEFPVTTYFISEGKGLFNRFFKTKKICDLDDLLIYRGCSAKVYEYLDYTNIESFYAPLSEKELEYYRDKYSNETEAVELLRKYALLLREYGSEVLNGNLDILKEVRQQREKNDREYGVNTFYSL